MKLYYSPGACSLASHISLIELDQSYELVKTDIRAKKTEDGRDFREINRMGYVPALELDGGEILTENGAILPYIASLKPGILAPAGDALGEARVNEALGFIGTELHKAFGPFFGGAEGEARDAALDRLKARIAHIEYLLGDGRDYLFGDRFSVADAYAGRPPGGSPGNGRRGAARKGRSLRFRWRGFRPAPHPYFGFTLSGTAI